MPNTNEDAIWAEYTKMSREEKMQALIAPPGIVPLPLERQVGGGHYKDMEIQPITFIQKNNLGFIEGSIIKYICRYQDKGQAQDLDKVIHYTQLLKELKYGTS